MKLNEITDKEKDCPECEGTGIGFSKRNSNEIDCETCGGLGKVTEGRMNSVIYKVFINAHGDPEDSWVTNAKEYDTVEAATAAAADLFDRWTGVKFWRVMDSEKQAVYAEGP